MAPSVPVLEHPTDRPKATVPNQIHLQRNPLLQMLVLAQYFGLQEQELQKCCSTMHPFDSTEDAPVAAAFACCVTPLTAEVVVAWERVILAVELAVHQKYRQNLLHLVVVVNWEEVVWVLHEMERFLAVVRTSCSYFPGFALAGEPDLEEEDPMEQELLLPLETYPTDW
jgi:hypothetical protein